MKFPIKDINFLPETVQKTYRRQRRRRVFLLALLMVVLFFGATQYLPDFLAEKYSAEIRYYQEQYEKYRDIVAFWLPAAKYRAEIMRYRERYSELGKARPYYEELQNLKREYARGLEVAAEIEGRRVEVARLIDDISGVLPPGIRVIRMEVKADGGVYLKFESPNPVDTARLIVGMRRLGYFKWVEPEVVPLAEGVWEVELWMPFKER